MLGSIDFDIVHKISPSCPSVSRPFACPTRFFRKTSAMHCTSSIPRRLICNQSVTRLGWTAYAPVLQPSFKRQVKA